MMLSGTGLTNTPRERPSKGIEMKMPVMFESVDTIVRTIDSEELSIRA